MEDDFRKPKYKDFKKQRAYFSFVKDPVLSQERSFIIADRPLVVFGQILIFAAVLFIYFYAPGDFSFLYKDIGILLTLILFYPVNAFYARFAYRHGRFHVEWEHPIEHPEVNASDNCERYGDFLDTEENRTAAGKSRRALAIFCAAVIVVVFLLCFLGYGLSYARIYNWHRGEIEEAVQIAQKYESLFIHPWNNDIDIKGETPEGSGVNEQDSARLKQIMGSLQWDYVWSMGLGNSYDKNSKFIISLNGGFSYSNLVRYEDIVDISQVKSDYPKETITQLDEHWWYVR